MRLQIEQSEVNRFGRRMARLRVESGDAEITAASIVQLCAAKQIEMLTLRVPTDRLGLAHELEDYGFRLMDCLVYYEAQTDTMPGGESRSCVLREASVADIYQVGELARDCFADCFSHYHADPMLDRGLVAEGYADWARRSCTNRDVAATVFLAAVGERVVGFAAMRRNSETEGEGTLACVHPEFRGKGIYGTLVDRRLQWCSDNGMQRMILSTQLYNVRVQRSWSTRGFRPFRSFFTFHRWFA